MQIISKFILPKYVFRGTTLGFEGSHSSKNIPYTCATRNPIKAVLFAMHCKLHYYHNPVIYIAKFENIKLLPLLKATKKMDDLEEAINFMIEPNGFYQLCEGYTTLAEMKEIFKNLKIPLAASVKLENLTDKCEQAKVLEVEDIDRILLECNKTLKK